jgi:hypothetical protein
MKQMIGLAVLLAFIAGVLLFAPASGTRASGLSTTSKVQANYPMPPIRRGQHRRYSRRNYHRYYQRHYRRPHRLMGGNGNREL